MYPTFDLLCVHYTHNILCVANPGSSFLGARLSQNARKRIGAIWGVPKTPNDQVPNLNDMAVVATPLSRFCLLVGGEPLYSSMGEKHLVSHSSRRFLIHMAHELNDRGRLSIVDGVIESPKGFDSYSLFSLQRNWIEPRTDNFSESLLRELIHDPLLNRSATNPYAAFDVNTGRIDHSGPIDVWLSTLGVRLVDLAYVDLERVDGVPPEHFQINGPVGDDDHDAFLALLDALMKVFEEMTLQQRTASVYLSNCHQTNVVLSMCLAMGGCTPDDFGEIVVSGTDSSAEVSPTSLAAEAREAAAWATRAVRFIELASGEITIR